MDILIVNNFVLSAITLRKPLDENDPQPYRDGNAVGFVSAVNNNSTKFIAIQPLCDNLGT